eukprot:g65042.t1
MILLGNSVFHEGLALLSCHHLQYFLQVVVSLEPVPYDKIRKLSRELHVLFSMLSRFKTHAKTTPKLILSLFPYIMTPHVLKEVHLVNNNARSSKENSRYGVSLIKNL